MAELLIVGFPDNIHRATGVLDELRVLDDEWITELALAVAVHRDENGALTIDQSYQPTVRHASDWDPALGLLIVASLPITSIDGSTAAFGEGAMRASTLHRDCGVSDTRHDRASFWMDLLGIPGPFFERAAQLVYPGNSAICALLEGSEFAIPAARFQRYGGMILHLTLSNQQLETIRHLLKGSSGHH